MQQHLHGYSAAVPATMTATMAALLQQQQYRIPNTFSSMQQQQ